MSRKSYKKLSKQQFIEMPQSISTPVSSDESSQPKAVLALVWKALYQYLSSNQTIDLDSLTTISAIIDKLITSNSKIESMEIEMRELLIKEDTHNAQKLERAFAAERAQKKQQGITPEAMRLIEQQLNLL